MSEERRRLRFTIISTILGSVVVFLDATVVNVALPAISDDLNTGLADQQWVVEAYLLALVALLLAYEHSLVRADDLSRVDLAFFTLNGWISVGYFVVTAAARWMRSTP